MKTYPPDIVEAIKRVSAKVMDASLLEADLYALVDTAIATVTQSESVQTITVPQGWKLVPVEPTEAMLDALGSSPWIVDSDTKVVGNEVVTTRREFRDQRYVIDGWIAMLAAAPEAAK